MSYYPAPTVSAKKGHFWIGAAVMFVGGIILGFIPFIGPFIAGLVGGKIVTGSKRAALAALLPTFVAAAGIVLLSILGGPIAFLGGFAGGIVLIIVAILHGLALLAGALIGGAL